MLDTGFCWCSAFADTLAYARQQIANGNNKEWKVVLKWSYQNQTPNKDQNGNDVTLSYKDDDYIVIHVLNEGTGTESLQLTDSIQMSYRGRLIPTDSYELGYVYDQTFTGNYDPKTASPTKGLVNGGWIDGFTTALLSMHVGDHFQVFIPQNLGYGSEAQSSIPAYSMLRFEMVLNAYKRGNGAWITE